MSSHPPINRSKRSSVIVESIEHHFTPNFGNDLLIVTLPIQKLKLSTSTMPNSFISPDRVQKLLSKVPKNKAPMRTQFLTRHSVYYWKKPYSD